LLPGEAWGKSSKNAPSGKYYHVDHCQFSSRFRHPSYYWRSYYIYLCLIPVVEASEQTIWASFRLNVRVACLVLPKHRTGSSPAFMIGPMPTISFLYDDGWCDFLGSWFGTGTDRGLQLLFTVTGAIGLIVTLMAMRSRSYRRLSANYQY